MRIDCSSDCIASSSWAEAASWLASEDEPAEAEEWCGDHNATGESGGALLRAWYHVRRHRRVKTRKSEAGRLDNEMIVTLPVSKSLPWYAAYVALANPLAGVGLLVGERVLRRPLEQFSSARYRIGGTLENPEVKFVSVFDVSTPDREDTAAGSGGDGAAASGNGAANSPPAEAAADEAPPVDAPAAANPAAEAPAAESPTAESPTAESPTAESPTAEETVDQNE